MNNNIKWNWNENWLMELFNYCRTVYINGNGFAFVLTLEVYLYKYIISLVYTVIFNLLEKTKYPFIKIGVM
jgi:hypothetical protein